MKKLSKITLRNSSDLMSEDEMKKVLGGYSTDSTYCHEGEKLYTCTTDFNGGYGGSDGVVCATDPDDAKRLVKETLQHQGVYDSAVSISCS